VSTCQAWLFVVNANECQLYRSAPVSQAKSPGFIMGSCNANNIQSSTQLSTSTLKASLPTSSSSVVPASHTAESSSSKVRPSRLLTRLYL
jgi:hypothetical protein